MDSLFPVHELGARPSTQWGDWCLGDLSDALRRVVAIVGPAAPAGRVLVYPPTGHEELPWVQVTVEEPASVQRLRHLLSEGEYLPHFIEEPLGFSFQAEVNDVVLEVSVTGR